MKTAIDKALEWFNIDKYRELDKCTDLGLLIFLRERTDIYSLIKSVQESDGAANYYTNVEYIRADPSYIEIFKLDVTSYMLSMDECFGDSFGLTPEWLRNKGHSCVAVKPLSVVDVACANDDLLSGSPNEVSKEQFRFALEQAVGNYRKSEIVEQEEDYLSYDQYLMDCFKHHTGHISVQIDLASEDEQILKEMKALLPLLRDQFKKKEQDLTHNSIEQSFLGTLDVSRKRKTRMIDSEKAKEYRVPALIDLRIWSVVEGVGLTVADYMRLVFPGDLHSEQLVTANKVRDTYLPYVDKCLNFAVLSAFENALKYDFFIASRENKNP